jgi:L-2-hydroxyglutarate oxidase LhgO
MDEIDCVVIGAGIVGLAVARALALSGRETLILEKAAAIGSGISSRNSEVVHSGLYYAPGSLKARLCVAGKTALYAYCASHGIGHRRCGKLIVAASDAQLADLESMLSTGVANGVTDLRLLDRRDARVLEPALAVAAALLSPSTGIVDSHALMLSYLGDAEAACARIAFRSEVTCMALEDRRALIWTGGPDPVLRARLVVNAASLAATDLARRIEGFPAGHIPRAWYAKGSYFSLARRSPFRRLIYPLPDQGGLGIHLTLDLAGQARFGPDVEWLDGDDLAGFDYAVDPGRGDMFYAAIRQYWPHLRDGDLAPAYAGIRPKLSGPGMQTADFRIDGAAAHGVPAIINLFGIESPGLTASLAIGERVAELAAGV